MNIQKRRDGQVLRSIKLADPGGGQTKDVDFPGAEWIVFMQPEVNNIFFDNGNGLSFYSGMCQPFSFDKITFQGGNGDIVALAGRGCKPPRWVGYVV